MDFTTDKDAEPGDTIQRPNGDRYIVLPNHMLAYIGNKTLSRSNGLFPKTTLPCTILGKGALLPYLTPGDEGFEDDWDALRGLDRLPLPLPTGCSCTHAGLIAVLNCPIHLASFTFRP